MIHGLKHGITLNPSKLTTENEIDKAIEALQNAGSIDYAMEKARELLKVGKSRLSIVADSEAKDNLLALADHMISRVY
jgi:geranylgeranyl diphosphate synthase type I